MAELEERVTIIEKEIVDIKARIDVNEQKISENGNMLEASISAQQESLFLKKMKNGLSENEKEQYEKLDDHIHKEKE